MDFLGIGLPEIILILIVALIVVGPKRLPEVAVQIARLIRQLRGYATDVTAQMRSELDELTREYEQVRRELREFRQVAAKDLDSVSREVDRTVREAPAIIESSAEPEPEKRPSPPGEETTRDDDS
jgi:Tat protein translocase TatB subunit